MARLVLQDAPAYLPQDRVLRRFGEHPEQRDRKGLGDELETDRLQVPGRGAEQRVEDFPDIAGERIGFAVEAQRHIAVQHLVVPRLVDDLRRLEQLFVLPLDILDQLAAHQHRAVLARHQGREPPPGDTAVELDPLRRRQAVPESGPMNIDEIVGNQPAVAVERLSPVDIGRRIPLIDLGLLVEPPHIGLFAVVDMAEMRDVADVDLVLALHEAPPEADPARIADRDRVAKKGPRPLAL